MILNGPFPVGHASLGMYLLAFAVTLSCETLVMRAFWKRLDRKQFLGILVANLVTHPVTVFFWIPYAAHQLQLSTREILLGSELVIPFIEFAIYLGFGFRSRRRTLVAAYLSNFASWTLVSWLQVNGVF